jgi:hypothetical protein
VTFSLSKQDMSVKPARTKVHAPHPTSREHPQTLGNSDILWVPCPYNWGIFLLEVGGKLFPQELSAKGARPADLGHWALGIGESLPCPMPHRPLSPPGASSSPCPKTPSRKWRGVFHLSVLYPMSEGCYGLFGTQLVQFWLRLLGKNPLILQ